MNERVYALLKELEWSGTLLGERTWAAGCPCCCRPRVEWFNGHETIAPGHKSTCELAALLAAENGGLQDVNAELLDAVQMMLPYVEHLRSFFQTHPRVPGVLEKTEAVMDAARAAIANAEKK